MRTVQIALCILFSNLRCYRVYGILFRFWASWALILTIDSLQSKWFSKVEYLVAILCRYLHLIWSVYLFSYMSRADRT